MAFDDISSTAFVKINKLEQKQIVCFFRNNLIDEEMLVSHLMRYVNYIIKGNLFHDKVDVAM